MSIKSHFSGISFRISVALLIFCPEDLSIDVGVVLIILLWLYSHQFPLLSLLYLLEVSGSSNIRGIYIDDCNILFLNGSFNYSMLSFFVFLDGLDFKVSFVWYEYYNSCFPVLSIGMKYLFPTPHFQSLCVLCPKVSFLYTAYWRFLLFYPICYSASFDWSIPSIDI